MRFSPLFLAFFALLLAACGQVSQQNPASVSLVGQARYATSPSGNDVAGGVFVKGVSLGGLSIAPAVSGSAKQHLGLTWSQAAKLFEASVSEQGVHINAILGFGFVSLPGANSMLGGVKIDHRPAWVGIAWGEITSCPAMKASKRPGTPRGTVKPIYSVVVIYGNAGLGAFSYDSRGQPPCGGPAAGPVISLGRKVESVPWILQDINSAGAVEVGFNDSVCAQVFSESASGNMKTGKFTLTLDVSVPFDPKGCSTVVTRQALIPLVPPSGVTKTSLPSAGIVAGHGPIGTVSVLQVAKLLGEGS
ncbi:MAG: hypothetical protein HKL81_03865 [Acidimicrobiaceae bacterium]|nr:hypothetical protein [Acidimicrobiaceae bacterium]